MKRFKKRPSPAMIVAVTALFISLVGTAFAGPIAEISNLTKGDKKQVRKISRNISGKVSNRQITKRAPGLNVASAQNAVIANVANAANNAINATNAKNAENAENAENAQSADTVKDGSVNGAKVEDRSLDADDVTQASGQVTEDLPSLAAGACDYVLVTTGLPSLTDYLLFASPGNAGGWPTNVIVDPYLSNIEGALRVRACNVGTSASDPPNTIFNWAVMKVG